MICLIMPTVYVGGVTVEEQDKIKYYQFASDAITYDVIDYYPMNLNYEIN